MRANWVVALLVSVGVVSVAGCGSDESSSSPTSPSQVRAPGSSLSPGRGTGTLSNPPAPPHDGGTHDGTHDGGTHDGTHDGGTHGRR